MFVQAPTVLTSLALSDGILVEHSVAAVCKDMHAKHNMDQCRHGHRHSSSWRPTNSSELYMLGTSTTASTSIGCDFFGQCAHQLCRKSVFGKTSVFSACMGNRYYLEISLRAFPVELPVPAFSYCRPCNFLRDVFQLWREHLLGAA